jgi:CMP-N-acetylneuraminic acid synthetase
MKRVCMIPARAGSTRIPNKNTRLLGGIPLISYVIRTAKQADCFDAIYVNSESEEIGKIAEEEGVLFHKRPEHLSSDSATNDDFTKEFMCVVDCEYVIQLLPTSPFISSREIQDFTGAVISNKYDTIVSVKDVQIECIYDGDPINFDQMKPTPPSQDLTPIHAYACTLMGWRKSKFLENMDKYGCAYHGGDGSVGFVTLKGFSEIDIDYEEDFKMAEAVWSYLNAGKS